MATTRVDASHTFFIIIASHTIASNGGAMAEEKQWVSSA